MSFEKTSQVHGAASLSLLGFKELSLNIEPFFCCYPLSLVSAVMEFLPQQAVVSSDFICHYDFIPLCALMVICHYILLELYTLGNHYCSTSLCSTDLYALYIMRT